MLFFASLILPKCWLVFCTLLVQVQLSNYVTFTMFPIANSHTNDSQHYQDWKRKRGTINVNHLNSEFCYTLVLTKWNTKNSKPGIVERCRIRCWIGTFCVGIEHHSIILFSNFNKMQYFVCTCMLIIITPDHVPHAVNLMLESSSHQTLQLGYWHQMTVDVVHTSTQCACL